MDKRLPLALLLSFLVLLGWQLMFGRKPPPSPLSEPPASAVSAEPATDAPAPPVSPATAAPAAPGPADVSARVGEDAERTLVIDFGREGEHGRFRATFTNRGAELVELRTADYFVRPELTAEQKLDPKNWVVLVDSVKVQARSTGSLALRSSPSSQKYVREPLDEALWTMREIDGGVEFELAPGTGLGLKKRVIFEPASRRMRFELELLNAAALPERVNFRFTPAEVVPIESGDAFYQEPQAIAAGRKPTSKSYEPPEYQVELPDLGGGVREDAFRVPSDPLAFAGVFNKYFAVLMRGADAFSAQSLRGATWRRIYDDKYAAEHPEKALEAWRYLATDLVLDLEIPAVGESRTWTYYVFAGPKDPEVLRAESPDYEVIVSSDLGFFDGIASVLLQVMGFFHRLVGNWGVAIILLTFSVRLLLFPINRRSQTAMARYQKKMKRVQPQIDEIKKRYASDPAKLRQEQSALMQKEGLFPPLGGCLPIFIQIPVFFGLFSALRTSFDLRQAPFYGWINDLSQPDHFLPLFWNTHLPFIGTIDYVNILPPLMVVLWVVQQMFMPKPADEQQARIHKMMMFMPILMGFFLYNYAAGLSLYMITQSTLGIVEQTVIKKYWPVDDKEREKKSGGFLARLAQLQAEQQKRMQGGQARKRPDDKGGKGDGGGKGGKKRK